MADRNAETKKTRIFFVNETHQLSSAQKTGGGALPKLAHVDWTRKGKRVAQSIVKARAQLANTVDPISSRRCFLLARPEKNIKKVSEAKGQTRIVEEAISYSGKDSQVFARLGIDLLSVLDDGDAIVHMLPEAADRLEAVSSALARVGPREQARWVSIQAFDNVPRSARVDEQWLTRLKRRAADFAILELQPLLSGEESQMVVRSIQAALRDSHNERFVAAGTDYSGRSWFRCLLTPETISMVANEYSSIQSIHEPLTSAVAASVSTKHRIDPPARGASANLPVVGILDCGVPAGHLQLADYCRARLTHPEAIPDAAGAHGSTVASRVVFGDFAVDTEAPSTWVGQCNFLDILISCWDNEVDDKFIVWALETAKTVYPDVRVFNMSFSIHVPVPKLQPVVRSERLKVTQDIDNFIFFNDVLVTIAAGNVNEGQRPSTPYPQNHLDDDWHFGHLACSFNSLTIGSFTKLPHPDGLASYAYAPSPFCKTGPGIAGIVGPDLSANGGDWNDSYSWQTGLGVSCLDQAGLLIDRSGTSLSAPIVAREAAQLLRTLSKYCDEDSRLFAATAKAFLTLTASTKDLPSQFGPLASVTLGHGEPNASRLTNPDPNTACFLWQGVLADHNEIVRIQIPIPLSWIDAADEPLLEVCAAWDTPVNSVVVDTYGCRDVRVAIRPRPDKNSDKHALSAKRVTPARNHSYPLSLNRYDLKANVARLRKKGVVVDDVWVAEVQYSITADYAIGRAVGPEQRVALALRLSDGSGQLSPYPTVDVHPLARSMTRLSRMPLQLRTPIRVRNQ